MITDPAAKQAALTTSPVKGPSRATRDPAAAGPTVEASRSITPDRPAARSSGTRLRSAASGTMTSLARSPGPRAAPISATRASSRGKESRFRPWRRGTTAAAVALARSVTQETTRGPTRSTTGPVSALTTTYGVISQKATSPVWVALPVVTSTNQGSAMPEIRVPVSDTAIAASTPPSARKERASAKSSVPEAFFVMASPCPCPSCVCVRARAFVSVGVAGASGSGRRWVITENRSAPSGALPPPPVCPADSGT
jgi:hypothetical protein